MLKEFNDTLAEIYLPGKSISAHRICDNATEHSVDLMDKNSCAYKFIVKLYA
jgi:hypothetical protein